MYECKRCGSLNYRKNGKVGEKQRYYCKDCRYNFTEGDKRTNRGKSLEIKQIAIQLYLLGLGFRAIGRFLEVSNVAVLNWVREAGARRKLDTLPSEISVMELDEMWHYCQKKEKSGSGWQFVVIANKF